MVAGAISCRWPTTQHRRRNTSRNSPNAGRENSSVSSWHNVQRARENPRTMGRSQPARVRLLCRYHDSTRKPVHWCTMSPDTAYATAGATRRWISTGRIWRQCSATRSRNAFALMRAAILPNLETDRNPEIAEEVCEPGKYMYLRLGRPQQGLLCLDGLRINNDIRS